MSNRMMRADAEMVRVLSDIISNKLRDSRINTSSDFRHCKVSVSILSNDINKKKELIKLLKKSSGYMKRELADSLDLPYIPELVFELDENLEYSEKINEILDSLNISKEENLETDNKED